MWEPVKIELSEAERERLEGMTRSRTLPARLVLRARIVLLAADGLSNRAIGADLGIDFKSAMRWRNRATDCFKVNGSLFTAPPGAVDLGGMAGDQS